MILDVVLSMSLWLSRN